MIPNRAKHLTRLLNVDEKGLIYFTVSSFVTIRILSIFKSILTGENNSGCVYRERFRVGENWSKKKIRGDCLAVNNISFYDRG